MLVQHTTAVPKYRCGEESTVTLQGVILSFIKLQIPQEVEPNVTSATFLKKNYQKKWQTRENILRKLLFQVQEVIFTLKIDFMSIMKFLSNSFGL